MRWPRSHIHTESACVISAASGNSRFRLHSPRVGHVARVACQCATWTLSALLEGTHTATR
eukprot:8865752-Alexandrium_andersonii.AAC.1